MRYFILLILVSCLPNQPPKDSAYFRNCRRKCLSSGYQKARVIETELKYTCECGREDTEKT